MDLEELREEVNNCSKCSLHATRTMPVFGDGNPEAAIMFVGEAPGYNEDQQGKPFVGQAGKLLDELLLAIGLNRERVYIANVLKCRPPENRNPSREEIALCKSYLFRQIEIIDPVVICTLGNFSTKLLMETENGISSLHGRVFEKNSQRIMPLYHPAAALRNGGLRSVMKEDFSRLGAYLEKHTSMSGESGKSEKSVRNKEEGESPEAAEKEIEAQGANPAEEIDGGPVQPTLFD